MLKIQPRNEKALMRKCNVLLDLGKAKECEQVLKLLEEVAFQSERSQAIYNEIKNINERIASPYSSSKQLKTSFKKEDDWYYNMKKEREIEEQFKQTLNPLFRMIYEQVYLRCCKKRRYEFK